MKGVQEIADSLDVALETLSREFKRCCQCGLKKVLIVLKIRHAVYLMQNPGMNLKEISALVGYEDRRRFNETFHRLLDSSPSDFRQKAHLDNFDAFLPQIL